MLTQPGRPTRVAFGMLEPYDGKLSRTVLSGEWGGNTPDLPDPLKNNMKYSNLTYYQYVTTIML